MMRHVSESIVLTWIGCFKRISKDPGILVVHVPTKEQVADILYKGSFNADEGAYCVNYA